MKLEKRHCVPCEGGVQPHSRAVAAQLLKQTPGWVLDKTSKRISRDFKFKNFREAVRFINRVAAVAEREGHHPDIHAFYNRVRLELWTHAIGGLSDNDFILAAKINKLVK